MKIIHVVGARPNFMKMAPVWKALKEHRGIHQVIVHTGQHYDNLMSDIFFRELRIKKPDINLHAGSNTHAKQTATIITNLERVMLKKKPDLVLVYGDVNSTMAASIVCSKLGIKTGHVEAGLRSRDMGMPEEVNRLITDRLSSILFTPSVDADKNLIKEGVNKDAIYFVGNVMIDTLISFLHRIKEKVNIPFKEFAVVTIHRPSNVDDLKQLEKIINSLNRISKKIPIIFPLHPRTEKQLKKIKNINLDKKRIVVSKPLGYLEFLNMVFHSKLVITDSGGIQEETTYLGVPCLTLRPNTERPVTTDIGTNTLVRDLRVLENLTRNILDGKYKSGKVPPKWDGKASVRIADIIIQKFQKK